MISAIIRYGGMTAAAKALALSQPALSRHLRHVEDRLGYPLFHRVRGRLEATTEALILYREITLIEARMQGVRNLATELSSGQAGLLRIGASSSLSFTVLPQAIHEFRLRCPGVKVVAHSRPAALLEEVVVSRGIDRASRFLRYLRRTPASSLASTDRRLAAVRDFRHAIALVSVACPSAERCGPRSP